MDSQKLAIELQSEVEARLPDFVKAVRGTDALVFHQDAFAADYQESEYALLGKAIKYAGIFGRRIEIIGTNRESLKRR